MSTSASKFVDDYVAAMNSHAAPSVLRFFDDHATYDDAALGTLKRGHAQILEFVSFFFHCYQNVQYTRNSAVGSADRIAWEWTLTGNYARTSHTGIVATGQPIRVRGSSFMTLRDDRILWNTDYWDIGTIRRQIEGAV